MIKAKLFVIPILKASILDRALDTSFLEPYTYMCVSMRTTRHVCLHSILQFPDIFRESVYCIVRHIQMDKRAEFKQTARVRNENTKQAYDVAYKHTL